MMLKKIYMMVTRDEYELPILITDSIDELAEKTGKSKNSILSSISHYLSGRYPYSPYRRIEIEEDEDVQDNEDI